MATKIIKCSCKSEYQDKKYGTGKRVHNSTNVGQDGARVYRCTVCGNDSAKT